MSHPPYRTRSDTLKLQRLIQSLKERGSDFASVLETSATDFLSDVKKDKTSNASSIPHYDPGDDSDGSSFEGYPEEKDEDEWEWEEEDTGEEEDKKERGSQSATHTQCVRGKEEEASNYPRDTSHHIDLKGTAASCRVTDSGHLPLSSKALGFEEGPSSISCTPSLDKDENGSFCNSFSSKKTVTKNDSSSKRNTINEDDPYHNDSKRKISPLTSDYPYVSSNQRKKSPTDCKEEPRFSSQSVKTSPVLNISLISPLKSLTTKTLPPSNPPSKESHVKLNDTKDTQSQSNSINLMPTYYNKLSIETSNIKGEKTTPVKELDKKIIEDFKIRATSTEKSMDLLENAFSSPEPLPIIAQRKKEVVEISYMNNLIEKKNEDSHKSLQRDREISSTKDDDVQKMLMEGRKERTQSENASKTEFVKCIYKDVPPSLTKTNENRATKGYNNSKEVTSSSSSPLEEKNEEIKKAEYLMKELKNDNSSSDKDNLTLPSQKVERIEKKLNENKIQNEKELYSCKESEHRTKVEISKNKSYTSSSIKGTDNFKAERRSIDKEKRDSIISNNRLETQADVSEGKCNEIKNNSFVLSKSESPSHDTQQLIFIPSKSEGPIKEVGPLKSRDNSKKCNFTQDEEVTFNPSHSILTKDSSNKESMKSLSSTTNPLKEKVQNLVSSNIKVESKATEHSNSRQSNIDKETIVQKNENETTKIPAQTFKHEYNPKSNESSSHDYSSIKDSKQTKHVSFNMTDNNNYDLTQGSNGLHRIKLERSISSPEISSTTSVHEPLEIEFQKELENTKKEGGSTQNNTESLDPTLNITKPGRRNQTLAAMWRKNKEKQRKNSNMQ